jgi:tRNA modification GTPase
MSTINRSALNLDDTLFALASGSLPSAVAILRLSGPGAFNFAWSQFRGASEDWNPQRGMSFGSIVDTAGQEIDSVLLLTFVAPHSFTGQDVIEIQCHGSLAVVSRIEALFVEYGFRPASKGEFTYRAFHNGKLSASEVENLGDLFLARDTADLDRIYRRKDASVEREVGLAREELVRLQAILDTAVDFSEEYASVVHSAEVPLANALARCGTLAGRYEALKAGARVPRLVLAGRPNAGKSSLFNALLCRYRAIVHASPGTTRDAIEEDIEFSGRRWKLVDTAGVRTAQTDAEREGIELGSEFLDSASYWVLVVDGTQGLSEPERELIAKYGDRPHLIVWNKKDLPGFQGPKVSPGETVIAVSALTGDSIRDLAVVLEAQVQSRDEVSSALPSSVQAKQLRASAVELEDLQASLAAGFPPEVLGEKNRTVLRRLEAVVGEVGVEDVLDRVFAEFCIGK